MMILLWLFLAGVFIVGTWRIFRELDTATEPSKIPPGSRQSPEAWLYAERGFPTICLAMTFGFLPASGIAVFADEKTEPFATLGLVFAVIMVIGVLLGAVVGVTGEPRELVPKRVRDVKAVRNDSGDE